MNGNIGEFTGSRYLWPWQLPVEPTPVFEIVDPGFDRVLAEHYLSEPPPDSGIASQAIVARGGNYHLSVLYICSFSRLPTALGRDSARGNREGFRLVRTRVPDR